MRRSNRKERRSLSKPPPLRGKPRRYAMDYRPRGIMTMAIALGLLLINPTPNADLKGSIFISPLGGLAEAKSYKSIALPECEAEIPGEVILPPYQPAFGYYEYARAADGSTITLMFYYDLRFQYFNKEWEELAPYVEFVKWEKGTPHLIGLSFVNEECKFVLYADENNDTELPAIDRLVGVPEPSPFIKRTPRPQTGMKDRLHQLGN